jgi:hypothetical protein
MTTSAADTAEESAAHSAPVPHLSEIRQQWPPEVRSDGITTHSGLPVDADTVFFAPPPPEIGAVLTAHCTMDRLFEANRRRQHLRVIVLPLAFLGLMLGPCLSMMAFGYDTFPAPAFAVLPGLILGPALAALAGYLAGSRPRHSCSYVGERGAVWYDFGTSIAPVRTTKAFQFDEATRMTDQALGGFSNLFANLLYGGRPYQFSFAWMDRGKNGNYEPAKIVFAARGAYLIRWGQESPDPHESWYHFAASAKIAWEEYRRSKTNAPPARSGPAAR